MKKKLMSILLCIYMISALCPQNALAATLPDNPSGNTITEMGKDDYLTGVTDNTILTVDLRDSFNVHITNPEGSHIIKSSGDEEQEISFGAIESIVYTADEGYYPMCRKTPCFSYGDIRHFHRIYVSN